MAVKVYYGYTMRKFIGNIQLVSEQGRELTSLRGVNELATGEKERIYTSILPQRLFELLNISPATLNGPDGLRRVSIIAPQGMGLARVEIKRHPEDPHTVFFLDITETHYRQMELSFCIISDPSSPRFNVDVDSSGNNNCFTTLGRNTPEEIKAMRAGLFPNQATRGLRMFGEFFTLFERFVDSLAMDMIVAEPLTYDNAIRYEKYGFDYLNGRRMMEEIDRGFAPGGRLTSRLDGASPFRMPGMEKTVIGRSWAIHDGIMGEPWEGVSIYKLVGVNAGVNTFTERR
jgi:hypothetical protein